MILRFFSLIVFSVVAGKCTIQMVDSSVIKTGLSLHETFARCDVVAWWFETLRKYTLMHQLIINSCIFEESLTSF
jgi:hypothetical protein